MGLFHLLSYAGKEVNKRKLLTYASSCSFYLFMSLIPLTMIFCSLLKFTPLTEEVLITYIGQFFSDSVSTLISRIVISIYRSGSSALTISILLCLYSASGCIRALMKGLDASYDFIRRESYPKYCLRAILYLILFVSVILFSLGVIGIGQTTADLFGNIIPIIPVLTALLSRARLLITTLFVFIFLLLIYTLVPAERIKMREQIPGALFSTIVWVLFSLIFSGYLTISDKYGAYGLIGTAMVTMLWFYYCILILLIGGFLNSFFCNTYSSKYKWNMPFSEDLFKPRR